MPGHSWLVVSLWLRVLLVLLLTSGIIVSHPQSEYNIYNLRNKANYFTWLELDKVKNISVEFNSEPVILTVIVSELNYDTGPVS